MYSDQTTAAPTPADRYLRLLRQSLNNELYLELEAILHYLLLCRRDGMAPDGAIVRDIADRRPDIVDHIRRARADGSMVLWPQADGGLYDPRNLSEQSHTMIGQARLDNLDACLRQIRDGNIPGDLIETGVWRGGATIYMRGFLAAHAMTGRTVWVADSFAGLPVPTIRQDIGYDISAAKEPILAISEEKVRALFDRYGLLDDQVRFLKGWFRDTLADAPIRQLALLRLDGDLYESTMDALVALYDKVVDGGFVIVDDYGALPPCRQAVDDFRREQGITASLVSIDWTGVYWRKGQAAGSRKEPPPQILPTALPDRLAPLMRHLPFAVVPGRDMRYGYGNPDFPLADAAMLAGMMRLMQPQRILEIGGGYSTALIQDTNEYFFRHALQFTCITRDTAHPAALLKPGDLMDLVSSTAAAADPALFAALAAGDILFISNPQTADFDATLQALLPGLTSGVIIGLQGLTAAGSSTRHEEQMLRAFLIGNENFRILLDAEALNRQEPGIFRQILPENATGIPRCVWLEKR